MALDEFKVGIIGLGQIGGSIASALRCAYPAIQITAADLNDSLCRRARERGLIDVIAVDSEDVVDQTEVVIIALPVLAIADVLRKYRESLREKILVVDTGSLKSEIMATAGRYDLNNFVGGHPLAGTELQGEQAWNSELFVTASFFTATSAAADPRAVKTADALISALGAERIDINPETHDRIFSVSSNLPHLFAYLLKRQFEHLHESSLQLEAFACPSYRGATRVARSDAEMVFQMLWGNRNNLRASLSELLDGLQQAQKALDSGDEMEFRRIFGDR